MIGIHQLIVRIIVIGTVYRLIGSEAACKTVAVVVLIVERYHGLGRETLGEPVHLIVNDEVGLIDSVVTLIVTTIRQATYDVILILRITTPQCLSGLTIWNLIGNRIDPTWLMIQLIVNLSLRSIRATTFLKTSTEVHREGDILRQEEVGIGTESITVIAHAGRVSIRVGTQVLEQ